MPKHPWDKDLGAAALTPPAAGPPLDSGGETDRPAAVAWLHAGDLFAGRYRMVTPVGQGGMGEVWRADDLVLQTSVALKLIRIPTPEARERILQEVRLARLITHPGVCRVFDVGEAEGRAFYSMELVDGEDLATLLRRAGRLPSERVAEIGRQLCDALAAAHAEGVLHRDLKPANVLVDARGRTRITDFGVAVTRDAAHTDPAAGTRAYMAPEQMDPRIRITERTDVYAVGLILYELVVGHEAFPDSASRPKRPARPSASLPDVDRRLERAILAALEVDPRRRPASAAALAELLAESAPGARQRVPGWVAGLALAAGIVLLTLAVARWSGGGASLTDQDTLVLADFVNTTGEPVFDGAMKVALSVALEQSPFLSVLSDERVRETLALMQRPPSEPITRAIARDIALREQVKAVVAGSIGKLGNNYVIALETINAQTGDVMAREQVEVASREEVLTALGGGAARMREKLGESLASVARYDVPLPRATTASLDALQAYSRALDEGRALPRAEAIPHLQRAIELDPDFAMAQAQLSGVLANTGRSGEAPAFSRRAFELRDRVSERERFFISWRYFLDAAQAWDQALNLARSWAATYPREPYAFNSLGMASAAFGYHDRAVEAFDQAIRLDERFTPPLGNRIGSLIALNRFDDARAAVRDLRQKGIELTSARRAEYLLAFIANDKVAMADALDAARNSPATSGVPTWQARTSAFAGAIARAHDLFQRSIQLSLAENLREVAAQATMEDAETHAIVGQCAAARAELSEGLALSRDNFTLERAARTAALCGDSSTTQRLATELRARYTNATLTQRLHLPIIEAVIALRGNQPARAVQLLAPVQPYDRAPSAEFWPEFLRGQAQLRLSRSHEAAAQFQSIIDHRGEAPTSPLYALATLGLARAASLAGDVPRSRRAYDVFLTLWEEADTGLRPLLEARRESTALR